MSAIFITATGTDIGKTYVVTSLIRHCRTAGLQVDALKPLATGFDPTSPAMSDTGLLLAALGRPLQSADINGISPWRYSAPLSPDMAARKEGKVVDFGALVDFCRRSIAACPGTLLIEGIGGVMVPLDEKYTVLDWMAALNIPVVLVTGSYLGSLSHTLTALDAMRSRAIAVTAVVLNETVGSTVSMADTEATLGRFAATIPIAPLPRGGSVTRLASLILK
jgi:dethiobiotin synthetase